MPVFKILRMRESAQQHFRWQPHITGATEIKQKDYQEAGEIEANGVYEAWQRLKETPEPLRVGDILQSGDGALRICKFVGFDEARWWVPEPKPALAQGAETSLPASGDAPGGQPEPQSNS